MKNWKPIDYIVALFAVTVSIILLAVIADLIYRNSQMTEEGGKRYTVLITSMISIISMYVGAKIQEKRDNQ